MGYTMLKRSGSGRNCKPDSLAGMSLDFIREDCEGLRFDREKASREDFSRGVFLGTGLKANQIPYHMQMDTDRLCLEKALEKFLASGSREDAFDVYFCYLEMFVGEYGKSRRMIELLSEFETNGSRLLMKHRDHYSHSVYVFALGLAIYRSSEAFPRVYAACYGLDDPRESACHYLQYWGLASLFHDIGYPFELPFEQVASYFEIDGEQRRERPYVAYQKLSSLTGIENETRLALQEMFDGKSFSDTDELFAFLLAEKLGSIYGFSEEQMREILKDKGPHPERFGYFMDHAYFSSAVLFQKLFSQSAEFLTRASLDALMAILMHNSLYKFDIAHYREEGNIPFQMQYHPLAYMLMLCDELQCWDRTAYGRNSRKELHPMGCRFRFSQGAVRAVYLYDEREAEKIKEFEEAYQSWEKEQKGPEPQLKAYSGMYIGKRDRICRFQADIEKIVDTGNLSLTVEVQLAPRVHVGTRSSLSGSSFIHLYHFAAVLNGRWGGIPEKAAQMSGEASEALLDAFRKLSLEYKLSNIHQAQAFASYLDEIGCFYTDREIDFEMMESFTREELLTIGLMEHRRWLQEHWDMGWDYGIMEGAERERLRLHKDMIPGLNPKQQEITLEEAKKNYDRLDQAERDKDTAPMECMLQLLRLFDGVRIYRLRK